MIRPQDVVKKCFQAAYGAEHLLSDTDAAREFFFAEFAACEDGGAELAEFIAPEVCRVNLAAWKKLGLPQDWLFNLFAMSARAGFNNVDSIFFELLKEAEKQARAGAFPFSFAEWEKFIAGYRGGPVRHSEEYRAAFKPAYRVISGRYLRLVEILRLAAGVNVIAIDGRAAAGKSTLAVELAAVTGAGVIHTDDFFLPGDLRTDARLSEPGGNLHYERFAAEVLPYMKSGDAFSYGIFDCAAGEICGVRDVSAGRLRIVEGAYSCHPVFGDYADLRIFCDVEPDEQLMRIEKRNGTRAAEFFAAKWIPLEEKYLCAFDIAAKADITF